MVYAQLPSPPNEPDKQLCKPSLESLQGSYVNEYKLIKKIGAGTFGLIYLVENTITGAQFAAKMVLKNNPYNKPGKTLDVEQNKLNIRKTLNEYFASKNGSVKATELPLDFVRDNCADCLLLREISLQLKVHQHPSIAKIHRVLSVAQVAVVIIMDYYPEGDLFQNIVQKRIFHRPDMSESDRQLMMKNVFLQLVDAVKYCQSQNIFHCDLKPENIMVKYNQNYRRRDHSKANIIDYNEIQVCLIDFGLAMDSDLVCCNVRRGSSFYMAPERITNYTSSQLIQSLCDLSNYITRENTDDCSTSGKCASKFFPTIAGDIWSLGVLLINITCARNPWPIAQLDDAGFHDHHVFHNFIFNNHEVLREILPISKSFNALLRKIFIIDPASRIDLDQLTKEIRNIDFFHDTTHQNQEKVEFSHSNSDFINEALCTPANSYTYYE